MKQTTLVALVILGQFISQVGNSLTGFAFGIHLLQTNKNVTDFSLLYFFQVLPVLILILPAGAIIDKFPKKIFIIACDIISIFLLCFVIYKYHFQHLTKHNLYFYVFTYSIFETFQSIAITTYVGVSINSLKRTKFNIFLSLRQAIPRLIAPLLAGFWLIYGSMVGLFILDIVSSIFAICMTILIKAQPHQLENNGRDQISFTDFSTCFRELLEKRYLLWSLLCLVLSICVIGLMGVYVLPIALHQSSPQVASRIIATGGLGAIFSGILTLAIPTNKFNFENFIPLAIAFQGLTLLLGMVCFHVFAIAIVLFIYFFLNPWLRGYSYSMWENSVNQIYYGKILAIKGMILQFTSAIVFLMAGPIIDKILTPILNNLSGNVQLIITGYFGDSCIAAMVLVLLMMGIIQLMLGTYIYKKKKMPPLSYIIN